MKYLKLFETQAQYDSWVYSEDYITPNVVFNEETKLYEIHMPNPEVVNAAEVDDTTAVGMVATGYSQVDEVLSTME